MKKKWVCEFKYISTFLVWMVFNFLLSTNGLSQEFKKTYVQELEVGDNVAISSNVPTSFLMDMRTAYSATNNTYDSYIVVGMNEAERLRVYKDYNIRTWDKNLIRQEVEVRLKTIDEETGKELMAEFEIELFKNSAGDVNVDANMNLIKFLLSNSRFKGDKAQVILNGGSKYIIEYLELRTTLFIPKSASLKIQSTHNSTIRIEDLGGDLDLDLQYAEVYGGKIKNLNANLRFCYNVIFEEANIVTASATMSYLKINKVDQVFLGKNKLTAEPYVNENYKEFLENNSSMNMYNFKSANQINIFDTANDQFEIGEVDVLNIHSSVFSTFEILKLNEKLNFIGKNGDISILEVNPDFKEIDINNTMCKLNLNVTDIEVFSLEVFGKETVDLKLPNNAKLLEKSNKQNGFYNVGEGVPSGFIKIQCDRCELDIWK